MESESTSPAPGRQRVWVSTPEACEVLGMSRGTLRQLRLRGALPPGKHCRRRGCPQGRGTLQWHLENVEASITGWSWRHLRSRTTQTGCRVVYLQQADRGRAGSCVAVTTQ